MLKCLRKLKDRGYSLESIIAVDDTPAKHARGYGNLVQVHEYTGGTDDDELHRLQAYLAWLAAVPNVRAIEKRGWRNDPLPTCDRDGNQAP